MVIPATSGLFSYKYWHVDVAIASADIITTKKYIFISEISKTFTFYFPFKIPISSYHSHLF